MRGFRGPFNTQGVNAQTFYNFLGTLIRSGITFITMPLFSRLLGAEQFGLYSIYASWLLIFTCFMGLNIKACLGTGYYKFGNDYYRFRSCTLVEGTVICGCFLFLIIIFNKPLSSLLEYPILILLILTLESIAQFILEFANLSWIYEKQAKRNMILAVITLFTTSLVSVIILYFSDKSSDTLYYGRIIGTAVPQITIAIFIWFYLYKASPSIFDKAYWKYSLFFGVPMVFNLLSQQVLSQSDRLMMKMYETSETEIGIYSFYYSFVAILNTVLTALNNSWCPFLYDDLKAKNYERLNRRIKNYVSIFVILSLGFLMVSREVTYVFSNDEYWVGMPLIPILVLVVYSTFTYQFGVNYEIFCAKPKIVSIGTFVAAATNIILNAILISQYGMYGAAIATLASYIVLATIHTITVKIWKHERYPLSYKYVFLGMGIVAVGCFLFFVFADYVYLRWILGFALGVYLIYSLKKRKTFF